MHSGLKEKCLHVYDLVFEQLVPNWRYATFVRGRLTEASTSFGDGYEGL